MEDQKDTKKKGREEKRKTGGMKGKEEDRRDERERGPSKLKNHLHSYTTVVPICNK